MDVITYPCWDYSQSVLVKEAPGCCGMLAQQNYNLYYGKRLIANIIQVLLKLVYLYT